MSGFSRLLKAIVYSSGVGIVTIFLYTVVKPIPDDSEELKNFPGYRDRNSPESHAQKTAVMDAMRAAAESEHPIYLPPPSTKK